MKTLRFIFLCVFMVITCIGCTFSAFAEVDTIYDANISVIEESLSSLNSVMRKYSEMDLSEGKGAAINTNKVILEYYDKISALRADENLSYINMRSDILLLLAKGEISGECAWLFEIHSGDYGIQQKETVTKEYQKIISEISKINVISDIKDKNNVLKNRMCIAIYTEKIKLLSLPLDSEKVELILQGALSDVSALVNEIFDEASFENIYINAEIDSERQRMYEKGERNFADAYDKIYGSGSYLASVTTDSTIKLFLSELSLSNTVVEFNKAIEENLKKAVLARISSQSGAYISKYKNELILNLSAAADKADAEANIFDAAFVFNDFRGKLARADAKDNLYEYVNSLGISDNERADTLLAQYNFEGGIFELCEEGRALDFELGRAKLRAELIYYIEACKKEIVYIAGDMNASAVIKEMDLLYSPYDSEIGKSLTLEGARGVLAEAKSAADEKVSAFEAEMFCIEHENIISKNESEILSSDFIVLKNTICDFDSLRDSSKQQISEIISSLISKYKISVSLSIEKMSASLSMTSERRNTAEKYINLSNNIEYTNITELLYRSENIIYMARTSFAIYDFYENIVLLSGYNDFPEEYKRELSVLLENYLSSVEKMDYRSEGAGENIDTLYFSASLEISRCKSEAELQCMRRIGDSTFVVKIIADALIELNYADSVEELELIVFECEDKLYKQRKIELLRGVCEEYKSKISLFEYLSYLEKDNICKSLEREFSDTEEKIRIAGDFTAVDKYYSEFTASAARIYSSAESENISAASEYYISFVRDARKREAEVISTLKYISEERRRYFSDLLSSSALASERVITSLSDISLMYDEYENYSAGSEKIREKAKAEDAEAARSYFISESEKTNAALLEAMKALQYIAPELRSEFILSLQSTLSELKEQMSLSQSTGDAERIFSEYAQKVTLIDEAAKKEELLSAKKLYVNMQNSLASELSSKIDLLKYLKLSEKNQFKSKLEELITKSNRDTNSAENTDDILLIWDAFSVECSELLKIAENNNFENALLSAQSSSESAHNDFIYISGTFSYLEESEIEVALRKGASEKDILFGALLRASDTEELETLVAEFCKKLDGIISEYSIMNIEKARETAENALKEEFNKYKSVDYSTENYALIKDSYEAAISEILNGTNIADFFAIVERAESYMNSINSKFDDAKTEYSKKLATVYAELMKNSDKYSEENLAMLKDIYERTASELSLISKDRGESYMSKLSDERIALMQNIRLDFISSGNVSADSTEHSEYPAGVDVRESGLWGLVFGSEGIKPYITLDIRLGDIKGTHKKAIDGAMENFRVSYMGKRAYTNEELRELLDDLEAKGVIGIKLIRENAIYDEFSGKYTVKILLPSEMRSISRVGVMYITDDGRAEFYEASIDGGFLVFETEHFSEFIIMGEKSINFIPLIAVLSVLALSELSIAVILTLKARKKEIALFSLFPMSAMKIFVPRSGGFIVVSLLVFDALALGYIFLLAKKLKRRKDISQEKSRKEDSVISKADTTPQMETKSEQTISLLPALLDTVSAAEADDLISDEEIAFMLSHSKTNPEICRGCKKTFINIDTISDNFSYGDTVTISELKKKGLIPMSACYVKVLARGRINKPLTIKAQSFSANAVKMISLTGGSAVLEGNSEYIADKKK